MPLKRPRPAVRGVEPLARQVGAVNTMIRTQTRLAGANTDVGGCVDAVRAAGLDCVERGVVVGSGATAASVLAALAELGAPDVLVLARSGARDRLVGLGADWAST